MDSLSIAGGTTVVGGRDGSDKDDFDASPRLAKRHFKGKSTGAETTISKFQHPIELNDRPFFVKIGKDGVVPALSKLDEQIRAAGHGWLLSKKEPTDWIGHEINPGQIGLVNHGGLPKVLTRPGRYPGFPLRNWWAREWCGTKGLSDTVIEFQGMTVVQVSQNQAAVISDPQNQIFVIKNAGFAAFALEGSYNVLEVIDQTHLPNAVKDRVTNATLGWTHEVRMRSQVGAGKAQEYIVALFLNIPASNCAVLQCGDDLEVLPAGQHCITNPQVTLRGMFTCGENQIEMPTKDIFTRDQVPVSLTIYLKWQLVEPLKLTTHGYTNPYEALRDKTQSILTQIMAHLDYSMMVKQRQIGPDNMEDPKDSMNGSSAFLDALRTRAMDEMHTAALEYGIILKDLAVIDRQFKGEIAATMDKLTTRAMQAQVEAANVDRENSNKVKAEEGALSVTRVKAMARKTQADADAYAVVAQAKANAEALQIAAEAQAAATRMAAQAESDAVRMRAGADENVKDIYAREMGLRRIDVSRVQAFGNRTVFVGAGTGGGGEFKGMGDAMATGFAAGLGAQSAGK